MYIASNISTLSLALDHYFKSPLDSALSLDLCLYFLLRTVLAMET